MGEFSYLRPAGIGPAVTAVSTNPDAAFLAGGTTQVDLMKDGVLNPTVLVDITRLDLRGIRRDGEVLRVGAVSTMAELITEPIVGERVPLVRQALLASASPQLRNMATIGGNLLQRTRCRYFRDPTVAACNKRDRGSGCAAISGGARMHAILGAAEACIAAHASDLAVSLVALDARVLIRCPGGERSVPLTEFYRVPGDTPDVEHVLAHGELITAVEIPLLPTGVRSGYLKIRDRACNGFALASAGVALEVDRGIIRQARVALGGIGTIPWRSREAEDVLCSAPATMETFRAAAAAAVARPFTVPGTEFKVELVRRTLICQLRGLVGRAGVELHEVASRALLAGAASSAAAARPAPAATGRIGAGVSRVDGPRKVTGTAPYPNDVTYPDLAHAALVRSTIAAGWITRIDTLRAEAALGVLSVLTHRNAPTLVPVPAAPPPPLQDDRVRHHGQIVAVVTAETAEQAAAAAALVEVSYAPAEPVLGIDDPRAERVENPWGTDVLRGDVQAAWADAEVCYEAEFTTAANTNNPLGLFATVARWEKDTVVVHDSTQYPPGAREVLAETFALPLECPDLSGLRIL